MKKTWLLPPFLLPASLWHRLDSELTKSPADADWRQLIAIDQAVCDSIRSEHRALSDSESGRLSFVRSAWVLTKEADLFIAGEGFESWCLDAAERSTASDVAEAYELFGELILASRVRSALSIICRGVSDSMPNQSVRTELRTLDSLLINPYGDASFGRLSYARSHRADFFEL